jgi:hypothetical protein
MWRCHAFMHFDVGGKSRFLCERAGLGVRGVFCHLLRFLIAAKRFAGFIAPVIRSCRSSGYLTMLVYLALSRCRWFQDLETEF